MCLIDLKNRAHRCKVDSHFEIQLTNLLRLVSIQNGRNEQRKGLRPAILILKYTWRQVFWRSQQVVQGPYLDHFFSNAHTNQRFLPVV